MAELDKQEKIVVNGNKEEEERLLEGMAATAVDFDMLCSTVASQTRGKWRELDSPENCLEQENGEFGGVFRMWEGEVAFDFMDDRRVALESACCPCYRFGKNMERAGLGYCFLQGTVYFILVAGAFLNFLAFMFADRNCFLYLAVATALSLGAYLGFSRLQIRRKFNIMGNDNFLDDCIYLLICPCCTLSQVLVPAKLCWNFCLFLFTVSTIQKCNETVSIHDTVNESKTNVTLASLVFNMDKESRTLEMNNVQDGTWHGRGDICIGSNAEGSKAFFELHRSPPISVKIPERCSIQNCLNGCDKV